MNTLSEYLELQRRVDELRDEVCLREQIKELQSEVKKLKRELVTVRKRASKHLRANHDLRKKYGVKTETRCDKARTMIAQRESGQLDITLKAIADGCFISYSTVKSLARDMRN